MPIDRSLNYQIRLDAIERAGKPHGGWGCRVWLTVAAGLGIRALTRPPGEAVGLALVAAAFLLWGLIPHHWTLGPPLPPELVPPPDPDDARIKLASNVCWWMGLGGVQALWWAQWPLELELERRDRARHPERPRPRYWLRCLVAFLALTGLVIWMAARASLATGAP